jgi:hypothetical protein
MTAETPKPLVCCGGIYAHKPTCANHRHTFDGPRDCPLCRAMARQERG